MLFRSVVNVTVEDRYMDADGKFGLNQAGLVTYSHGAYFELGKKVGSFGYSVRKPSKKPRNQKRTGV